MTLRLFERPRNGSCRDECQIASSTLLVTALLPLITNVLALASSLAEHAAVLVDDGEGVGESTAAAMADEDGTEWTGHGHAPWDGEGPAATRMRW